MYKRLKEKLQGINAVSMTPFRSNGEIDYASLGRAMNDLIHGGIEVIYPCGAEAQFYCLSAAEAKKLVRYAVRHVAGKALVIAGVGHDTVTALELLRNAEEAGADGVMIHQPLQPGLTENSLFDYYFSAVRASRLPVLLSVTDELVTDQLLRELSKDPQIIGIIYAHPHLPSFAKAVKAASSELVWICGCSELWAPFFFTAGASGFLSSLVNVDNERPRELLHAMQQQDRQRAMHLWNELRQLEEIGEAYGRAGQVSVMREAMAQLGRLNRRNRPPMAELRPDDKLRVSEVLKAWGLK